MNARDPGAEGSRLVAALAARLCKGGDMQVLETHISWVILAGEHALKIKKPVRLAFADFSSLEDRRRFCEEELRLGRRTAPQLYEAVVAITGTPDRPALGGDGAPIEWAVLMRRFPQELLLDRMAQAGAVDAKLVDALAEAVARLHASVPRAEPSSPFGTPAEIRAEAEGNFEGIGAHAGDLADPVRLRALHEWTRREGERLDPIFTRRHAEGFVRECHGDLHLGNVAVLDGRPVPFDAIDFSEPLRWIDVMSEVAFPAMDLEGHGLSRLAHRFVDAYLSRTGDYGGLAVLTYYTAYRALVRAKVAAIRFGQSGTGTPQREESAIAFERHLEIAGSVLRPPRPALIAMHGLPGSGKTTFAQELLESLGAVRVRSDVERKRVHGLDPLARTSSPPGEGLYDRDADDRTQARLLEAARQVLEAGRIAIVDSTAILRSSRALLRELARDCGVPFVLACCSTPESILRERVARRERAGKDASEANVAVLERHLAMLEPLTADELDGAVIVDGARGSRDFEAAVESVRSRLA